MDYEIRGDNFPILLCKLKAGEEIITRTGSMGWHTQGICKEKEDKSGLGNIIKKHSRVTFLLRQHINHILIIKI